jgi:predicted dehydrogenase
MEKVRIGVVGLGNIAQTIHLPILTRLPDAEVVAVCDLDIGKARTVAQKFGIPRSYSDYEKMLEAEDDIGGIDICASTFAHKEIAVAALKAKKHTLVEKPLARTQKETIEIVSAAKKHQRQVMVGMNSRFRPDAMILRSFIEGNELGKIYYSKAGWFKRLSVENPWFTRKEQSGGGVVLDLGIVMFDLAFWMMGYPSVKEVIASTYAHNTKEVEDSTIVFIRMKNGSTMTLEASWSFESTQDFFYCDVFGTDGSGSLNPFRILKKMHGNLVNVTPVSHETPQSLYRKSYENELKHWVGSLRGLHAFISTGEDAVHRMKVVDAIYKSAKSGKSATLT